MDVRMNPPGLETAPLSPSDDASIIRSLIDQLGQAIRAKDAQSAIGLFAPGNIMYSLEPPLEHRSTGEPDPSGLEQWFATWQGRLGFEVGELHVVAGTDVAFCHGLMHLVGTKTDGERNDLWFRETYGFQKLKGQWKIVHTHESVPFEMDGSGRASLHLKPEAPRS